MFLISDMVKTWSRLLDQNRTLTSRKGNIGNRNVYIINILITKFVKKIYGIFLNGKCAEKSAGKHVFINKISQI